jgi:hypothetical protein
MEASPRPKSLIFQGVFTAEVGFKVGGVQGENAVVTY